MNSAARKIAVVGPTCSGKTTVARRLAHDLGVPHVELDALHWGPGWSMPTPGEFRERVTAALPDTGWVVDGEYMGKLGSLVLDQTELIVWLDFPLTVTLRRLWSRTVRRIRQGNELWGGNRETWRGAFFSRESLFLYALKTHLRRRRTLAAELAGRNTVRLPSRREVDAWLA